MNNLIKARPSRLAPFEATLFAMEAERKTLAQMRQWLAGQGVTVSLMAISKFLTSRRELRWQAEMLGRIVNGQEPVEKVGTAFQTQPEPALETLIKLSRLLVFERATKTMTGPEFEAQHSKTTSMVVNYLRQQDRLGIKKSEIALAEKRLANRARDAAPNPCPDHPKPAPDALELFKAALATVLAGPR
jgi:hypothetical protein